MKKELRNKKIDVRFTELEYRSIEEMERAFGISKADLIRNKLLTDSANVVVNSKAMIAELDKIGTELGRSGNNINQLAHYANQLKLQNVLVPDITEKFNTLFAAYLDQRQTLEAILRNILRQLKK